MGLVNRISKADELSLIDRASRGDLNAFNELVLAYQGLVYSHVLALLGDPDTAEDVTQESFIKAFQKAGSLRGPSFRSWLLKIATNTAFDFLRRSRRYPSIPLFPEDGEGDEDETPSWLADPNASVPKVVERRELLRELQRMLDELPSDFRSVITLVDVYGLDYAEAANALGVPMGTIKSRLARGRLRMQEKVRSRLGYSVKRGAATAV